MPSLPSPFALLFINKSGFPSSGKTSAVSGKSTPASSGGSDKKPRKRHFLGQLSVDRQYLENLLQHPGEIQNFL
jgi:hypothetical protein